MDARQLAYFVAVSEERSFTRAAERTFAVQSSVSAGIRALEAELGGALFERSPRRVEPTELGRRLLDPARAALAALDRVRDEAQPDDRLRGRLRVGIFTNLPIGLPELLGEFHARHPLVDLRLTPSPSGSTGLLDDVRRGRVDVAFSGLPPAGPGWRDQVVARTRFVAVLPDGHPFARADAVPLAELAAESFLDTPPGFGNRTALDAAFAQRGLSRRIATEVSDLGEIQRFVAAGLGIAVIPEVMVVPAPGATAVPLVDPLPWTLRVVSREQPGRPAEALFALLAERFPVAD